MSEGRLIRPSDMELGSVATGYEGATLKEARDALEHDLIERTLAARKGNISRAASDLGISRPTLYELMTKLGIERP
jgi:two-component system, NtrC family, response regulator